MTTSREADRQQQLLAVLGRSSEPAVLVPWMPAGAQLQRGLQVYLANAGALAERALAAAYPVTQQLLGADSFAQLARALWLRQPPPVGDAGAFGAGLSDYLADFVAGGVRGGGASSPEPYLPDLARLEWAVHRATTAADAADAGATPHAFDRLADTDPATLWLLPRPGTALLQSAHPVASIWLAHQHAADAADAADGTPDRFADARAALACGRGESALVWRQGWQVRVAVLDDADATFTRLLLQGTSLGAALSAPSDRPGFDFDAWLVATLTRGWLLGARALKPGIA